MDDIAHTILKHDGIIWGEYVWSKFSDHVPTHITARFVSLNIFNEHVCPKSFLMDLNEKFTITRVKGNDIWIYYKGTEILLSLLLHTAVDEMAFFDNTDYTCNLIDYSRNGYSIRKIPPCLNLESSPYDTVITHIKNKTLSIVNVKSALKNYPYMAKLGWSMTQDFVRDVYIGPSEFALNTHYKPVDIAECAICKNDIYNDETCVRTACLHSFHLDCVNQWYTKSPTCPLCRDPI